MPGIEIKYLLSLVLLLCITAGCSTMQPIDNDLSRHEVLKMIEVGDQIKIKTKSDEYRTMVVTAMSDTSIELEGEQFAIDEIEIIALRKPYMIEKGLGLAAGFSLGVLMSFLITALFVGLLLSL